MVDTTSIRRARTSSASCWSCVITSYSIHYTKLYEEPGSFLGLAASASYNLQLGGELERRVSSHQRPIAPLATQALVSRNLGDELRAAAFPSIRLSRTLTVYGSASYYRRATDRYALAGSDASATLDPAELERNNFV